MPDLLNNLTHGLAVATTPDNLLYCFIGVLVGTAVGVIPGIGALAAISMLFPLTFHIDATSALIMLAGIWYGTTYGGSTTSILLNMPGTAVNAITCLDGYPMAKQGRGAVALFMTTVASFAGCVFGIVLMILFAPIIASYALAFGSTEYFSMMFLGLVAASSIAAGSILKNFCMVLVGMALGVIGLDLYTGSSRLTFGLLSLSDGINLVVIAMGIFGVSEIIYSIRAAGLAKPDKESLRLSAMLPTSEDAKRSVGATLRGGLIGGFFGALPGTGSSIASLLAYGVEKRVSREPERFGRGAIEGIMAPETANNAADQTAFIPTLTLGVPGSATMALMLGALIIHGITPGPLLMTERPDLFWGLIMSFWIGNIMLVLLNIPLVGIWVRLLLIPYRILYPAALMFMCIGVYSVTGQVLDVLLVAALGGLGYALRLWGYSGAPLLLGFVLGPLMEEHFRRAMLRARGDVFVFIEQPVSAAMLLLCALLLSLNLVSYIRARQRDL